MRGRTTAPVVETAGGRRRRFGVLPQAFTGGAAIGIAYALIARPHDEVFVTDSWSYVPADDWWLHGLLLGVLFALVYVGVIIGLRLAAFLIQRKALFTIVGALLLVMSAVFFGRAAFGDESIGGRVTWVVLGVFVGVFGVPMIVTEHRWRRRPDRRRPRT